MTHEEVEILIEEVLETPQGPQFRMNSLTCHIVLPFGVAHQTELVCCAQFTTVNWSVLEFIAVYVALKNSHVGHLQGPPFGLVLFVGSSGAKRSV